MRSLTDRQRPSMPHSVSAPRPGSVVVIVCVIALLGVACTNEEAQPIDLNATTTTVASPAPADEDPNAAQRLQLEELAKEECRKDPTREVGVVVIVDPSTGDEVNRFELPCADLADDSESSPD